MIAGSFASILSIRWYIRTSRSTRRCGSRGGRCSIAGLRRWIRRDGFSGSTGGARTTGGVVAVRCTVEARLVDVGVALVGLVLACVSHAMTPTATSPGSRSAPSQRITDRRLMGGSRDQGDRFGLDATTCASRPLSASMNSSRLRPPVTFSFAATPLTSRCGPTSVEIWPHWVPRASVRTALDRRSRTRSDPLPAHESTYSLPACRSSAKSIRCVRVTPVCSLATIGPVARHEDQRLGAGRCDRVAAVGLDPAMCELDASSVRRVAVRASR